MASLKLPTDFLQILACPESKQSLFPMPDSQLEKLNSLVSQGKLRNLSGRVVSIPLEAALIRQDNQRCYPVRLGIPLLLSEESIAL